MKHAAISGLFISLLVVTSFAADAASSSDTTIDASTASSSTEKKTETLKSGARPLPFRAGDALEIITYPDTTAFPSGFYPIDGEGFVDFPIIGYTKVTDKSADALATILAEKYIDFMRYPHMRIRPMIRVALNGGFYRPGLYWINPHATLWETLQIAGGTQRTDGFKKMKWERDRIIVNKDLVPLLQSERSLYQIGFKTGDQLTVTQKPHRTGWEVFRTEALPMLTFSISTATSLLTVYAMMQYYNDR